MALGNAPTQASMSARCSAESCVWKRSSPVYSSMRTAGAGVGVARGASVAEHPRALNP